MDPRRENVPDGPIQPQRQKIPRGLILIVSILIAVAVFIAVAVRYWHVINTPPPPLPVKGAGNGE